MPITVWVGFIGFVLAMLLLDLGVFHRRAHAISIKEALGWTVAWIALALVFNLGIYYGYAHHWLGMGTGAAQTTGGRDAAIVFLTAFVLEKSLSLDNIFVIALIFAYFRVPRIYQHRVLFWGILGVLILRGTLIGIGTALTSHFGWVNYGFGVLLIYSAIKMLRSADEQLEPDKNTLVRAARHLYPVSRNYEGGRFFTTIGVHQAITPLLVVLLVIESTDLMFALDSIPAVFGVTKDPFLAFTSNIFAVLGLRSLYFVLSGILHKFKHLKVSLFLVLVYVGLKMLVAQVYQDFYGGSQFDAIVSLIVILGILAVGAVASIGEPEPEAEPLRESEVAARTAGAAPIAESGGGEATSAETATSGVPRAAVHAAGTSDDLAIRAVQVTKFYGRRRGITDLSAMIPRGSLVGLLGPNGAGKTTAIRILSCHMPPTTGSVRVCGFDVFSQSLEIRKRLGYLPENCPLYTDMRVLEYLRWTAQMKGMSGSDVDRSIFRTLEPCGIDHVRGQVIGTLSKGYRQRVGLAAALIHQPEILILDEPTIGLDPLQGREFRNLIGSLKGKHTVLISSHILSEIDVLCDSVIILNEGSVVAAGPPQELRSSVAPRYTVECRIDPAIKILLPRLVQGIAGITMESYEEDGEFTRFRLTGRGPDPRLEIFRSFAAAGIGIREMSREKTTLEDVFLHYTRTAPEPNEASANGVASTVPSEPAPGGVA